MCHIFKGQYVDIWFRVNYAGILVNFVRCSQDHHILYWACFGNCWGHSAVKWSARQEPASQIPQISEYDPFDLYGETHWQYIQLAREILPYSWPNMFDCRFLCCHNIFGQSTFIIRSMPDTTVIFNVPWLSGELNDWRSLYSNGFTAIYI